MVFLLEQVVWDDSEYAVGWELILKAIIHTVWTEPRHDTKHLVEPSHEHHNHRNFLTANRDYGNQEVANVQAKNRFEF